MKNLQKIKYLFLATILLLCLSSFTVNRLIKVTPTDISSQNNKLKSALPLVNYTMTPGASYSWIDASGGTELFLGDDGYATIALPFSFTFYDQTFSTIYLGANGYLSFTDTSPLHYANVPFPLGGPDFTYMIAPFWDDIYRAHGGNIYVQSFGSYWVAEWLNIYHIHDYLIGSFEVVLYDTGEIVFNYDYLDYSTAGYTCGLNLGVDMDYYNMYQGLNDLTDDFAIQFTYELPDHDLSVSLETPTNPEIGESCIINATVTNHGLNDEYDVDLLLYLDDGIVDSTTISSLPVGASETINYIWTPSEYKKYNFTAYAPPVPSETYSINNFVTKLISIRKSIFFEDFESGLSKWETITGLWHLTDNTSIWSDPYHSPTHSMWFGNESTGNFDTGYHEMGDLISYPIDLSSFEDIILEFYHWREGEGGGWDISYVNISIDGINWDLLYQSSSFYIPPWEKVSLDISGYAGNSSVQLKFSFDTIDGVANDYRGWLVDDIEILGTPSLTITTPDSTSSWETGTDQSITWTSTDSILDVKIELYKNDVFVMEIVASTPNDGEFSWTIPTTLVDSTQYQIKISDVANPATDDFSEDFEIFTTPVVIDSITITNPDSLTAWEMGTSQDITWTSTGTISDVKIELYKDGVFEMVIVASTANDGSYNWTIPTDLEDGIDYQIKISDVSNPTTYDESPNFAITSVDIPGPVPIPSYNLFIVMGIITVVSVVLIKKRFKLIK